MVSRVEYDDETNRLVGFATAVSFETIEESFRSGDIAKYALVYNLLLKVFLHFAWCVYTPTTSSLQIWY